MVASSFNHTPGLPILKSSDLVHWQLIGHALKNNDPMDYYKKVQHGAGVWAPSIRFHQGKYYIYYPDPDFGIYQISAKQISTTGNDFWDITRSVTYCSHRITYIKTIKIFSFHSTRFIFFN
jgi:beta-xylosidase